jgi:hypothetical protein
LIGRSNGGSYRGSCRSVATGRHASIRGARPPQGFSAYCIDARLSVRLALPQHHNNLDGEAIAVGPCREQISYQRFHPDTQAPPGDGTRRWPRVSIRSRCVPAGTTGASAHRPSVRATFAGDQTVSILRANSSPICWASGGFPEFPKRRSCCLDDLNCQRRGLATTDAQTRDASRLSALAECAQERHDEARSRCADRVTQRASTSMHVHALVRKR